MEAESRKRGREKETTETLESERGAKKVEKDGYYRGGREEEEEEEEEEREMGVFEFPWQKGREGVMTEEEWKEAGVVLGETFLGTLGREREREREEEVEVEIGGGMRWWRMEDMTTSTSSPSCCLSLGEEGVSLNLEEWWEDRDGIWAGHPSSIRHAHNT